MSFGEAIAPLLGRLILAWFFLSEAWRYADDWTGTTTLMAMKDVPAPGILLFIAFAAMIMGGVSVLVGWKTRLGALVLFAFTLVSTIMMHDYWTISDASARQEDYEIFARNLAIAGGLLLLVGLGGGKFALDNVRSPGSRR
jgi:putative oxidoreductase